MYSAVGFSTFTMLFNHYHYFISELICCLVGFIKLFESFELLVSQLYFQFLTFVCVSVCDVCLHFFHHYDSSLNCSEIITMLILKFACIYDTVF